MSNDLAWRIVTEGPQVLDSHADKIGDLWGFETSETNQLRALRELMENYLATGDLARPLCIAVFGPPGSGKSFAVEQLVDQLDTKTRFMKLNLTQIARSDELAAALRDAVESSGDVPVVFFDEFDAPRDGAPWGWLDWFLAPMQDGVFRSHGASRKVTRAVFVFAGGTANQLADFGRSDRKTFAIAKGPDFVSRLRGYLDVRGPNQPANRSLRRASLLEVALRVKGEKGRRRAIDRDLFNAFCDAGRFRHGARSIHAIAEMAISKMGTSTDKQLGFQHLPAPHLLAMHVDRGVLDPTTVGGLVGVSGGGVVAQPAESAWKALASALWQAGAALAFGGTHRTGEQVKHLLSLLSSLPQTLDSDERPRLVLFPEDASDADSATSKSRAIEIVFPDGQSARPEEGGSVQATFAMRWRMSCRCIARLAMAGKIADYSGRMPGIFEEIIFALALRQPVYVLGKFGGAAAAAGALLGLASSPHDTEHVVSSSGESRAVEREQLRKLRIPGYPDLPLDTDEARPWLIGNSIRRTRVAR